MFFFSYLQYLLAEVPCNYRTKLKIQDEQDQKVIECLQP